MFGTDFATPDGTGVRDYIHVSDLAAAHVHALDRLIAEPTESLTMNAGYGHGYSVMRSARRGRPRDQPEIERAARAAAPGDPAELVSDNRRILATLPWRPQYDDLDQIVRDALAWERKLAERQASDTRSLRAKSRSMCLDYARHERALNAPPSTSPGCRAPRAARNP